MDCSFAILESGDILWKTLVTHRLPLNRFDEARTRIPGGSLWESAWSHVQKHERQSLHVHGTVRAWWFAIPVVTPKPGNPAYIA